MALVEIITLFLWVLVAAFAAFCFLVFWIIAINVFCLMMLLVMKFKKKIKMFDLVFAPAIWAMSKMEEEK